MYTRKGFMRRSLKVVRGVGNDLMTPRPGFEGLTEGCRWCLCVSRYVPVSPLHTFPS